MAVLNADDTKGTRKLARKLSDGTSEVRYSTLRELTDRRLVEALKPFLLDVCLNDPWGPNRSEAARALRHLWPDGEVRGAFRACMDAESYVANTAVEILAEIMDDDALSLLKGAFAEAGNAKLRYSILQAFCQADDGAIREFVLGSGSATDEDERIRALSLSLLARSADPGLKGFFTERLQDESQRVRAGAVEALSAICSPEEIVELLPPCLEDSSNRVRANALVPLLKAGYRMAEARLLEMAGHTSNFFRSSAAYVLGELTPTPIVVSRLDNLTHDEDPAVRDRARTSVQRLGLPTGAAHPVGGSKGPAASDRTLSI